MQQRGDLLPGFVDRRGNNVRWCLAGQLDDVFTQIRFDDFVALLLQMRVEVNLLSSHRLALDDYVRADALRLCGEALEVLIQAGYGALFNSACLCPQFLGIAQSCHGGYTTRHEVGNQQLQGLLQRSVLERLPGMFLKTLGTEMLGSAARLCVACYVCGHGP